MVIGTAIIYNGVKMSKSKKVFDELNEIMTSSLLQMHKLVEEDVTKESDFISMASLFIIGLMSTASDLSKLVVPGSAAYFYTEIEAAAKNGGLRGVKKTQEKGGNSYSISNIAPDDLSNAMNYLG